DGGQVGGLGFRLTGSSDLYGHNGRLPYASINFITAHDGFTLAHLVSYNEKHNLANGEKNFDGNPQNDSWNCGVEGPTSDPSISSLRERQQRNFLLALFLSQGIPMLFMGDEYGHTRQGNNNPYVQDNELNWFLWDQLLEKKERFDFISSLIAFRKNHPIFRKSVFLTPHEISWHTPQNTSPEWHASDRFLALTVKGPPSYYLAFHAGFAPLTLTLPPGSWIEVVNTSRPWKEHNFHLINKTPIHSTMELPPHSALLLTYGLG
ncbi:MAG: glycogen-debranching protein, partial [Chlamydiia bacterium]|nr:glycogen-debranching protein [Chlamydiia bacterium]